MDRFVIRDTSNMEFLTSINEKGIITDNDFKKAIIFEELERCEILLEFIDDDDFVIEEIIFNPIAKED